MPILTPLVLNQGSNAFKSSLSQIREQIKLLPQIRQNFQVNNNLSETKLPVQVQGGTIYLSLNNVKLQTGQYPSYLFINKISNQTNVLYQNLLSLPPILPKVNLLAFNYKDIVNQLTSNDIVVRNNQVIKLSMLIEAVRFFDIGNDVAQALRGVKGGYVDFAPYGSKITNWHDNAINSYRQVLDASKSNSAVTLSNLNEAILPTCGFNQNAYLIDSEVKPSISNSTNAWLSTGNGLKSIGALQTNWCINNTQQLTLADFNGDGKADFICHSFTGGDIGTTLVLLSNGTGMYSPNIDPRGKVKDNWCREDSLFFLSDFNGDGKADFICHSYGGGTWVLLSNGTGVNSPNINSAGEVKLDWCVKRPPNETSFLLADFNGDSKTDLICHGTSGDNIIGKTWVLLSNGTGVYLPNDDQEGLVKDNWCNGTTAFSNFNLADFNGDDKLDFICHNTSSDTLVLLSNGTGVYSPNDNQEGLVKSGWCSFYRGTFMPADFNGDGKTDFVCLDQSGIDVIIPVLLSNGTGVYSPNNDPSSLDSVCNYNFGLFLADFNGDGKVDVICRSSSEIRMMLSNGSYFKTIQENSDVDIFSCSAIALANVDRDCTMDVLCFQGSMSVANSFNTSYPG